MITYDYYRIFYHVAVCQSFTKAAKMLCSNQPNVTRCMNNLENELECKLFIRSNRGVTLTPEGKRLFSHVAAAYEHLEAGELELKKDRSLESGHITIGTSETALRLFLLDRLEAFHQKYPNVRLKLYNHSTPQAITFLENGLVDFSVVTTPIRIKHKLNSIPLYSFHELLIGGSKYKNLSGKTRSLKELRDYPLVSLNKDTGTRELYIQYFLNHGLTFLPDMEVSTADQILPMVIHNLGIGFYPEELAKDAIQNHSVVPISIKEPLPQRQVCLVLDKNRPQSIAVDKIVREFLMAKQG